MDAATIQRVQEAFWATIGLGILAGLYFYLSHRSVDYGPTRWSRWMQQFGDWRAMSSQQPSQGVRSVPLSSRESAWYPPNERTNEPANPPNAAAERGSSVLPGAFVLNADECIAVARMIDHKTSAEKPTKASTIWAGFGLKKGESAKYQRASLIYDTLFVLPPAPPPAKYAELDEQRRPILN
jgi:hypothetical protein